jgi:hypothetical protein
MVATVPHVPVIHTPRSAGQWRLAAGKRTSVDNAPRAGVRGHPLVRGEAGRYPYAVAEESVLKLLGPGPTWLRWMYFPLHFELVVDGAVATDVWPGVVAIVEVAPGTHHVRLQRPYARFLRSTDLEVVGVRVIPQPNVQVIHHWAPRFLSTPSDLSAPAGAGR